MRCVRHGEDPHILIGVLGSWRSLAGTYTLYRQLPFLAEPLRNVGQWSQATDRCELTEPLQRYDLPACFAIAAPASASSTKGRISISSTSAHSCTKSAIT